MSNESPKTDTDNKPVDELSLMRQMKHLVEKVPPGTADRILSWVVRFNGERAGQPQGSAPAPLSDGSDQPGLFG